MDSGNRKDDDSATKSATSTRSIPVPSWVPKIGMTFNSVAEAKIFWNNYGSQVGFVVRQRFLNTRKVDKKVTFVGLVCAKEGYRPKDRRDHLVKNPRAETRIGCKCRMGITLNRVSRKYEIHDVVLEHNHRLQIPETIHIMPSQRSISDVQAFEIELADKAGIQPRIAHELASQHVGGASNVGYTCRDLKNHLHTKRHRDMNYGEAGCLLSYFQRKITDNPPFKYALQLDKEEQIANIFWDDAKMIIDYAHFGDVVTFDTTFGTNRESRPFGVFVGFNQFRECVVFGAALMYDETFDSFKWLFDTFLTTHGNRHPRTIFTDQDIAMGLAIAATLPNTWDGLCAWHIMQHATKHLNRQKIKGSSILGDFSACIYQYEDMTKFEEVFADMRSKVHKQSWLDSIYNVKEKWAECYMNDVYTLGMRSTQLSESLNNDLKEYLNSKLNIDRFFGHFERVVQEKREKEIFSEYESRNKLPRIKMRTLMLLQASKIYTPQIFEAFRVEYERSMSAYTTPTNEENAYVVGIGAIDEDGGQEDERVVVADCIQRSVQCSCKLFEKTGLLSSHALKVLYLMNIKQLPEHYILKRWTLEERSRTIKDNNGREILEDPKLEATRCYKFLSHKFNGLASRAANFRNCVVLVDNAIDSLINQVEEIIEKSSQPTTTAVETTIEAHNNHVYVAGLKKKETKTTSAKRKNCWNEKFHKKSKQTSDEAKADKQTNKGTKVSEPSRPPPLTEQHSNNNGFEFLGTYTQLLMGETSGADYNFESSFGIGQNTEAKIN